MFFGIIITRILFVACMVFIIGYVFGNFSKNSTLAILSKVAVVAAIVLFIAQMCLHSEITGGVTISLILLMIMVVITINKILY